MTSDSFKDAALVLFGHGSTVNAQSGEPVFQHAAELKRRGLFAEVREAFWKQEPLLRDVWQSIAAPRVFLAPLFISEGYFSEQVIPGELGFRSKDQDHPDFERMLRRGPQTFYYCRAVGSHTSMATVVLARAREVASKFPFPRAPEPEHTTLFIAGHGTEQNKNSRAAIDVQVEQVRHRQLYAAVQPLFLDQAPLISDAYRLCETRTMIVVPFFISDGMHVQEDIPVLLGEPKRIVAQRLEKGTPPWRNPTERNGKLVWLAPSVGTDPLVTDVILERVREVAAGRS